jgi:LysM repeat protein/lysophospholipase L1-like esterase
MRNPSRAILLAVLMASLILPPGLPVAGAAKVDPASRAGAKRLMLVGDSLAIGLGQQLAAVFAGTPGVTFVHQGKVSSGLANPAFFNWETRLAALVAENHPDLVLFMFGANDNKPLPSEDGRSLSFGSPEWGKAYAARLTRLADIVRADNPSARLYVLGVPIMADPAFNAEMARVNAVLAATAGKLPGAAYIETRDVLADPSGAFAAEGRRRDGTMVRLRAGDGVHISGVGSRLLAARCLEAVSGAAGLSAPGLIASLEDRDVRPTAAAGPAKAPVSLAEAHPVKAVQTTRTAAMAPKTTDAVTLKPVAAAKPATQPAANAYQVAEGDTLWSVAKRLGVVPDRLAQANPGVDPHRLTIGQSLAVPAALPDTVVATAQPASLVQPAGRAYAVAEGDNFWSIAKRQGVTVAALTQANPGVEPTRLRIGQSLAIPEAAASAVAEKAAAPGKSYTVADGDNFWSIAHRLGVDMAELKRANADVDPLRLRPGQILALPDAARLPGGQAQAPAQAPRESRIMGDAGLYPVSRGDTLWGLSRRFGVSLDTILSANGEVDPVRLQVGQLVTIPGSGQSVASSEVMLFPVSAGDTLWAIARRFDVSVEALAAANPGIDPLRLREGQTLRVPSSLAAVATPASQPEQTPPVVSADPGRLHSVVSGDTLWQLARHFGVSLDQLLEENAGIDPVRLRVGQTVRLPGSVVSMAAR